MSNVLAEVSSSGVGIRCSLTYGEIWNTMTIQRIFENGSIDAIVNLTTSGISVNPRYRASYIIEGTDVEATVMFDDVKCADAGNYSCFLEGSNYPVAPVTANLTITGIYLFIKNDDAYALMRLFRNSGHHLYFISSFWLY